MASVPHQHDQPTAGRWRIAVSEPYPVFCELFYEGKSLGRFQHRDLPDLEYVVIRARHVARENLGDDFREA